MGALHQGHLSLVKLSQQQNDITVVSIFVNPTQFNNREDLEKYPRTLPADLALLGQGDADVVFSPEAEEMYPDGLAIRTYNWGPVTHSLEGAFRPGHFDGVITIVQRLFELVEPDRAYFGRKDFQQCAVIMQMVKEFNMPVEVILGETVRDPDGLAMSSRNARLSEAERKQALILSKALFHIRDQYTVAPLTTLLEDARTMLAEQPLLKPEYLEVVDPISLEPVLQLVPDKQYVALIASWCGNVRLIDNITIG